VPTFITLKIMLNDIQRTTVYIKKVKKK